MVGQGVYKMHMHLQVFLVRELEIHLKRSLHLYPIAHPPFLVPYTVPVGQTSLTISFVAVQHYGLWCKNDLETKYPQNCWETGKEIWFLIKLYRYIHLKPPFGLFMKGNGYFSKFMMKCKSCATSADTWDFETFDKTFQMRYCMTFYFKNYHNLKIMTY